MSLCVICRRSTTASACQPCEARLTGILTRVPGWYDALEHALIPGQRPYGDVRVTTSKVHPPLPVNLHVLTLRSRGGIATTLREWETDVRTQRGDGTPYGSDDCDRMVRSSVSYLVQALPWAMTQYEQMRAMADALDWIENTCLTALGVRQRRRYIGTCPEILDDHQECGRSLYVGPADMSITCACGTSWPRTQWVRLATSLRVGA